MELLDLGLHLIGDESEEVLIYHYTPISTCLKHTLSC